MSTAWINPTRPSPASRVRRFRRLVALVACGVTAATLLATQPAEAAATTGSMTTATCGWRVADGPGGGYKITRAALPRVSGVSSTPQLVELVINFMHPQGNSWVTYQTAWFYTYARAGAWSTSWTYSADGRSGYLTVDDAPGNSGELNNWTDTGVKAVAYWMNGSQFTGAAQIAETNPNDLVYGQYVCNGGPNFA
jgi:hypothetical protein